MTIANETTRARYSGSGTSYAVPFIFYDSSEVKVIRTSAAGVETTLTETTDYSVSGGSGSTGTVTTVTSYSDGQITVIKNHGLKQSTDYVATGSLSVETLEQDLDKLTLKVQELKERLDRALRVIPSTDMTAFSGKVTPAAGKLIGFNADASAIITYEDADQGDADLSDLFNGGYAKSIYPADIFFAAGVKILEGTGSPEGAVEASIGSIFIRKDGGAGTSVYFKESGSGDTGWIARNVLSAPTITTPTVTGPSTLDFMPRDLSRGLVVKKATVATVDIDADELILHTTDSPPSVYRATSVNLTVDLTASGANGLDTGAEAASKNYYTWTIYNPTTDTVAGLISLSKTAPTMPAGFTFKALVGEFFNDSGSDITYVNQWNGSYFEGGTTGVGSGSVTVITNTDVVDLELGNLTVGDIIEVGYWVQMTKSGATGATEFVLKNKSGFTMTSQAGNLNNAAYFRMPQHSSTDYVQESKLDIATVSGSTATAVMKLDGTSAGSNGTIGVAGVKIFARFIKKQ